MAWFQKFFDQDYVEILRDKRPSAITRREVASLSRSLRLKPGQHLLDAPCGFGRHAREFVRRGVRVTGVDLSRAMLGAARPHPRIEYRRLDLRKLDYVERFDAIYSSSNGYFTDRENRDVLRRMARALKHGGRIALWTFSKDEKARDPKGRRWTRYGPIYVLNEYDYAVRRGLYRATWTRWRVGRATPRIDRIRIRGYSVPAWRSMFRAAGLRLIASGPKPTTDGEGYGLQLIGTKE